MGVNESEIDKILNEVEELRKELTSETGSDAMAEFREPPATGKPSIESELLEATLDQSAETASDMEATLAALKPESSPNLTDLFKETRTDGGGPFEDEIEEPVLTQEKAAPAPAPAPKPELKVIEKPAPVATVTPVVAPTPAPASTVSIPGELKLSLTGAMTLKLQYECEGQDVTIAFTDGTLRVSLADGTEFKIPLAKSASARVKEAHTDGSGPLERKAS